MMIKLEMANRPQIKQMQETVTAHHYLHRPVDTRCSVEAYRIVLSIDTDGMRHDRDVGLLMFGRPEATRCGNWYGSVEDVASGRCEVTRWQVLNLARVWLSPDVQPGGYLYRSSMLPGFVDRRGTWRSTLASAAIKLAAQQIGFDYLFERPPCFLDEPYQIEYLLSYCDRKVHRGVIYQQSGFELYRTNDNQIETWRLRLPPLTAGQDASIHDASAISVRAQMHRSKRLAAQSQASLF